MRAGEGLRRQAGASPIFGLILACLIFTGQVAAAGAAVRPAHGDLSPRLDELSKQLIHSASDGRQAQALSLPSRGAGSLLREGDRVLVEVRFEYGAATGAEALREVGARVANVSRRYQTVTVAVDPVDLAQLSKLPRVTGASEVLTPIASATSTCPAGAAISEGDEHLRAANARTTFGVDGTDVEVGVLSDSFDEAAVAATHEPEDVERADLPGLANSCPGQSTPVTLLEDFAGSEASDEGRAMAQIVHDLAPRADLSFATAFTGLTAFAENVEELAADGADVIVDDVAYFEEPFFQEGPVGVAVSNVTDDGVTYFSSAGNNNLVVGGKDIASWEADGFRDAGLCPTGVPAYATHCMDFDPGAGVDPAFALKVSAGETLKVDVQWAQPWNGVTTDLDAYLLSATHGLLAKAENFNVTLTQKPFEFLSWTNSTGTAQSVRVAFNRCDVTCGGVSGGDGGSPRLKLAVLQNGGGVTESEYPDSIGGDTVGPTIFGHNGAADAVSAGAIRFDTTAAPEGFSSRGPVTHYFAPADGILPASPLASPQVLAKPDLVATDCGLTTFFVPTATPGVFRFCGTSAAAPHAAAVAALMRDANQALTPAQIRSALVSTARTVGPFGLNAVGAGLVDAVGALDAVADPAPGKGGEEITTPPPIPVAPDTSVPIPFEPSPPQVSDRVSPATFFRRRPGRAVLTSERRARVVFVFGADEAAVSFACRVDGGFFRPCGKRLVRRFRVGTHALRVMARDAAGNADRTPAVARFRVKRRGG